jgi:hypothetical protein
VIIEIEIGEQTETPDKKGGYLYSIECEKKYYGWDGKAFKLLKTIPKKKVLKSYVP